MLNDFLLDSLTGTNALTKRELQANGFEVTDKLKQSIYILADGSLWGGCFVEGKRTLEHIVVENFTTHTVEDGSKFWEEVATELELVMILPEKDLILIHPEQVVTDAQREVIIYAKWLGFDVVEMS